MNILKKILIAIAMLIAAVLLAALFIKKDYAVEKQIVINKPKQTVFDYIKLLKNQDNYSKWAMMDPNMTKTYRGTDGTVGFVSAWDSKQENVGAGEQEIKKIIEGERIDLALRFTKPFEAHDDAYLVTEAVNDSTTNVKWGFTGAFPYPMNVMNLFMDMEKAVGGDLQTGLENLKKVLEK
ncbi:MAG TPA: SRPBCC family protein [Saprospiraceae bacterium]|nr:SRPBCC family protein [Saprospiraceae bacterium]HMV23132.1 SRPBCC family protein [Saprospiraceae bacterium]HMX82146.1 SRPBCC family protein [Saprospiraceae bacterium]HMX84670.1 SRPBCC family protein [Saprospiraceae bacterium]HMZ73624.1 SRPBCC family protein [Saprospiraceae bacterium]